MTWHKAIAHAVKIGMLGYRVYRGDPAAALTLLAGAERRLRGVRAGRRPRRRATGPPPAVDNPVDKP